MKERAVDISTEQLHAALCAALSIEPGRGSKKAVAKALEIGETWYNRVMIGDRGSLDTAARWCAAAGVVMTVKDCRATYEVIRP